MRKALRQKATRSCWSTEPGHDHDRSGNSQHHLHRTADSSLTEIIRRERPDALLPTVGGQTALNLAIALGRGRAAEYGVEMIGANRDAIKVAENRLLFKQAMDEAGIEMPRGGFASRGTKRKRSCS